MQINDAITESIGPGQLNDILVAFYLANGAVTPCLPDAEYEFLIISGASPEQRNDLWLDFLNTQGHSGQMNDALVEYWTDPSVPAGSANLFIDCEGDLLDTTANHTVNSIGASLNTSSFSPYNSSTSSVQFDTGDYLSVPDSEDWDILSDAGDATIDFFVSLLTHADYDMLMGQIENDTTKYVIVHSHGSGLAFFVYDSNTEIMRVGYGGEIEDSNWHHIALVKEGATYTLYKDGVSVGNTVNATTLNFAGPLSIGAQTAGLNPSNALMDNIRFTKGSALWTGGFTLSDENLLY